MPEHILYVVNKTNARIGPSETFLQAHLEGMKCRVTPVLGVPCKRVVYSGNNGVGGSFLLSQNLAAKGVRWLMRKIRLASIQSQDASSLVRLIREKNIDLVFAEYGPTGVSVMDACRKTNTKLIVHFHGWDAYTDYNLSTFGEEYKKLFLQASAVIAVSNHMKEQLISLGAERRKVFYNPCGAVVDTKIKSDPKNSAPNFIMIGRLTEKKSPTTSIRAFSEVLKICPDARLEIIGDGPLKSECDDLIRKLGISRFVTLRGAQPHQEVLKSLSNARCFIQHSVVAKTGDREGTPVAVLEAMGFGLPVVSTYHGGIQDIVDNGVTGSLVEEHDEAGMTREMIKYAKNPSLAAQIGAAARLAVLENWTNEKSNEKLWSLIESVSSE